jgi:hypothetical protein
MIKFRRGDTLNVELVIVNKVGFKDLHIYFIHEEDDNEHIHWGLVREEDATEPVPPALETTLSWDKHIEEDQKLGVYVLGEMNFLGSDDTFIDVADSLRNWKFEVVPADEEVPDILEAPPIVNDPISDLIVVKDFSLTTPP